MMIKIIGFPIRKTMATINQVPWVITVDAEGAPLKIAILKPQTAPVESGDTAAESPDNAPPQSK